MSNKELWYELWTWTKSDHDIGDRLSIPIKYYNNDGSYILFYEVVSLDNHQYVVNVRCEDIGILDDWEIVGDDKLLSEFDIYYKLYNEVTDNE